MPPHANVSDLPGWPPIPPRVRDILGMPNSWGWIEARSVLTHPTVWYDEHGALWVNGDATPQLRHLDEANPSPGAIVFWTPNGLGLYVHPTSYQYLQSRNSEQNTSAEWIPVVTVASTPPVELPPPPPASSGDQQ